ncbi:microfibril-associated glycoprotein 4-like [Ruditapes philippinarum]|uniref:microfibril-associated glycoprotein 4-like n=1 Tax=Ruditapes philippinarum TaxID=129788 RepID=UPI00295BD20C|nr:microfibril-associated glycoprotein 4-like [Ruditapes philippinarum]
MSHHNNCRFSSKDSDNDQDTGNCAQLYGGAWWYKSCHNANLNGLYLNGANTENSRGINWGDCWGYEYSLKNIEGNQTVTRIHKQPEPIDCLALHHQGYAEDGVYVIKPAENTSATDVWCDMSNGGWTVIQRRQDGLEDFYRGWEEYKNGFGNRVGEYWLGLENIYYLTENNNSLYIYMETFQNDNMNPFSAFAEFSIFRINDENDNYRLTVGGYEGPCADSMWFHNGCQFTSKDSDYDASDDNCAVAYKRAWWYNACHKASVNGLYLNGTHKEYGHGIIWAGCWGQYYSLKITVMKLRRSN